MRVWPLFLIISLVSLFDGEFVHYAFATKPSTVRNWNWCDCLGVRCQTDQSDPDHQRQVRMSGYLREIFNSVHSNPQRFLPSEEGHSISNTVTSCLQNEHGFNNSYLAMRNGPVAAFREAALRMFPIKSLTVISREVANSPEGLLPRSAGARLIQDCNGDLHLQIRDDLNQRELQEIFSHLPQYYAARFTNVILESFTRSVDVVPIHAPDTGVVALLLGSRTCNVDHSGAVSRRAFQYGAWNYSGSGWETPVSRERVHNTFPLRYLPENCRRGRAAPISTLPHLETETPIRSFAEYQAFLLRLREVSAAADAACETDGSNLSEQEEAACDQLVTQANTVANGIRRRARLDQVVEFERQIAENPAKSEIERLQSRRRIAHYRLNWEEGREDTSLRSFRRSLTLDQARYCAAHGYCDCSSNDFLIEIASSYRGTFQMRDGMPVPPESIQEYRELFERVRQSRLEFARANGGTVNPDGTLGLGARHILSTLCNPSQSDGITQFELPPGPDSDGE